MIKLLSIVFVLAFATISYGQWCAPRAATELESYLNGLGRLRAGTGQFFNDYGDFLIEREEAQGFRIENWENGVRSWWAIRDEWKDRNKSTYLENRVKRIEALEADAAIREREDALIEKGILAPRRESHFVVDGVKFRSMDEYRASDQFKEMQRRHYLEEMARQVTKEAEAARQKDAIRFLAMWDKMGFSERQRFGRLSRAEKAEYVKEYYDRDYMDRRLKERSDARFYETRPYLSPSQ